MFDFLKCKCRKEPTNLLKAFLNSLCSETWEFSNASSDRIYFTTIDDKQDWNVVIAFVGPEHKIYLGQKDELVNLLDGLDPVDREFMETSLLEFFHSNFRYVFGDK